MRINLYSSTRGTSTFPGSVMLLIVGIIILVVGLICQQNYNNKKDMYVETYGSVIGYETKVERTKDEDGYVEEKYMYSPKYEYIVNDIEYTIQSNEYSSIKPSYGREKKILYNPENPNEAIIETSFYFIIIIFGAVATVLGVVSIIISIVKTNETL